MQVEVSENWMTVGSIIGFVAFGAIAVFSQAYMKSREDERTAVAASPSIARDAVGAAFVDRSTAQDVAVIRDDVSAIRKINEDPKELEDQDRVDRLARDAARDEVRRHGPKRLDEG